MMIEQAAGRQPAPFILPHWGRWQVLSTLLLGSGLIAAAALLSSLSHLVEATLAVWRRPELLLLFVGTYSAAFVLRAQAWRLLLGRGPGVDRLFSILQVALLANHVFPTKAGEVVRAGLLARTGTVPLTAALGSTALARLLDFATLCGLALTLTLLFGSSHGPGFLLRLALPVACLGSVAFAWWLLATGRTGLITGALPPFLRRAVTRGQAALSVASRRRTAAALLLVAPSWVLEAGAVWTVGQATGTPLSLEVAVAVTAVAVAFQAFQVTPGGLGVYEASMTGALAVFSVPPEAGMPIAVATHMLKYAYAFAAGLPCLVAEAMVRPAPAGPAHTISSGEGAPLASIGHLLAAAGWLVLLALSAPFAAFRMWPWARARAGASGVLPAGSLVAVVIPVHNEAGSIERVVCGVPRDEMERRGLLTEVILVDDGSTDNSGELALSAGAGLVVRHPSRRGLGAALRSGLEAARRRGAAAAVYLDGDGEYDPADIPAVLAPVVRGESDYVLGVRFPDASRLMSPERLWGNRAFTLLMAVLTGRRLTDAQTGFRAFSAQALARARIVHDYNYSQVLTLNLIGQGLRLSEEPVRYRLRQTGRSFIRYPEYAHRVFSGMVRELWSGPFRGGRAGRRPHPHWGLTPGARAALFAAVAIGLGLFYQLGVPLRSTYGARVSGDEPFYLLTTVSLLQDGDLDLANDYALQRYRAFFDHSDELWHQSVPRAGGQVLSPHNVGLSLLVLPAYALGGVDAVKAFLAGLGGITLGLAGVLAFRVTGRLWASTGAAALVGVTAPLFIYASQVYPEMPAALVVTASACLLAGGRLGWRAGVLLSLMLTALLWLGVKYALLASVLAVAGLLESGRGGRLALLTVLAPAALSYAWFHWGTYGGLTPYAVNLVYAGSDDLSLVQQHLEVTGRLYRLAGLWFDGEFGVARWAPVLLLCIPGLVLLQRNRRPSQRLLLAILGAQILAAAFLSITMRGWWFPGRMLIVVLPLLAAPLAAVLARRDTNRWPLRAVLVLGSYSAALTLALWAEARDGLVALSVDPFNLGWEPFRGLAGFFPVYTEYRIETWLLTAAWVGITGLLVLVGLTPWRTGPDRASGPAAAGPPPLGGALSLPLRGQGKGRG